jgi:hypothetical protein
MPIVVNPINSHVFRTWSKLSEPLLKRLETELDVGVGTFVVGLTPPLGLVVAVAGTKQLWVVLDAGPLELVLATTERATATGPYAAFAVELVNPDGGLLTALAGHIHVIPP